MLMLQSYMSNAPLQHLCAEFICVAQICEAHNVASGLGILHHDDGRNHLKNVNITSCTSQLCFNRMIRDFGILYICKPVLPIAT
jgi:hypothetical protein